MSTVSEPLAGPPSSASAVAVLRRVGSAAVLAATLVGDGDRLAVAPAARWASVQVDRLGVGSGRRR